MKTVRCEIDGVRSWWYAPLFWNASKRSATIFPLSSTPAS